MRNGPSVSCHWSSSIVLTFLELLTFIGVPLNCALPQTASTGALIGVVLDLNGRGIPGAALEAKNQDMAVSRSPLSDDEGRFVFSLLPPGKYQLTALKGGYSQAQSTLTVSVTESTRLRYITAGIVVIAVQFLLILGLLSQRVRKRKAEGRLESIVSSAMDAIIAIDNEQRIMLFNTAAEKMFGYHASEVIGDSSERLIPHRFRAQYSTYIRRFGETPVTNRGMGSTQELWGLRATGEEFPIEASISHLEAGGKNVFTVIMRDVTVRKQAEEARFAHAAVVESSDDAIIAKNLDGIIVSWNVGAQQIFGYTQAEVVGQPITILIPTEMRDEENKILEKIRAGERIEHYETIRVTKAGNKVNVSLTISPIKDTTGRVVGASKIARDITERKRAEEALRASEERFRLAAQAGKMFAYEWDLATDVIVRSGEAGRTLGIDEGLVTTGQQVLAQVHPEDRERVMSAVAALSPEKPHLQISFRMVRTDGTIIWVERSSRARFDDQGRMLRVVGMVADVSERRRAEEQLQESEERFRLVATMAPVMIWMSGPDKLCTYFNQPRLTFTGRSIHDELGNGWAEGVHPEDLERCLETYKQAFDRREPFEMEYRLRRHDGEYRWIFDYGVARFNADGSFAGYIGSASDLTDQKLAREALEKVSGQLIEAQEKERRRLARELHDDICQRLATLSLRIEKVTKGWGGSQSSPAHQLEQIWQQCSDLTVDVQALSHELHPSILDNLGLVTAVRGFCREVSEHSGVVVEFDSRNVPASLPSDVSLSLFRVVQEALHNAVKYSGQKHFEVRLQGESDHLELEINDKGVGFDAQNARNGRGLGLVSMSERIHQVNGTFTVDSHPKAGTRIYARVPLTPQKGKAASAC